MTVFSSRQFPILFHKRWATTGLASAIQEIDVDALCSILEAAASQGVDLAVVDTAPRVEQSAAARTADLVLIPCRPAVYDLETVAATRDLVRASRRTRPCSASSTAFHHAGRGSARPASS